MLYALYSIKQDKLWGLRMSLIIAWNAQIHQLISETYSLVAIQLIQSTDTRFHPFGAFIDDYCELLCQDWDYSLVHIHWKGNQCENVLANLSHEKLKSLTIFYSPLVCFVGFVLQRNTN
ncbi:RVT_3 domain-containing protein [Cephalotus follicularis]|uniref:RVT_3 domain-containing protein n=1 Tax=Cephalotus follicularis TaxID=3775 RepID=A0A1Q3CQP0_CEPFO|nr:RVT_3 domain-containing protein [Cephalotus follicularis]